MTAQKVKQLLPGNKGETKTRKRRPGGGRKPSAYTKLRRRIETEQVEDAEYAFALYSKVMRNSGESLSVRLAAADWIANRVLGKPKERQELSGKDGGPIEVNAVDYRSGIAALAPRPVQNSDASGEAQEDGNGSALGENGAGRRDRVEYAAPARESGVAGSDL